MRLLPRPVRMAFAPHWPSLSHWRTPSGRWVRLPIPKPFLRWYWRQHELAHHRHFLGSVYSTTETHSMTEQELAEKVAAIKRAKSEYVEGMQP